MVISSASVGGVQRGNRPDISGIQNGLNQRRADTMAMVTQILNQEGVPGLAASAFEGNTQAQRFFRQRGLDPSAYVEPIWIGDDGAEYTNRADAPEGAYQSWRSRVGWDPNQERQFHVNRARILESQASSEGGGEAGPQYQNYIDYVNKKYTRQVPAEQDVNKPEGSTPQVEETPPETPSTSSRPAPPDNVSLDPGEGSTPSPAKAEATPTPAAEEDNTYIVPAASLETGEQVRTDPRRDDPTVNPDLASVWSYLMDLRDRNGIPPEQGFANLLQAAKRGGTYPPLARLLNDYSGLIDPNNPPSGSRSTPAEQHVFKELMNFGASLPRTMNPEEAKAMGQAGGAYPPQSSVPTKSFQVGENVGGNIGQEYVSQLSPEAQTMISQIDSGDYRNLHGDSLKELEGSPHNFDESVVAEVNRAVDESLGHGVATVQTHDTQTGQPVTVLSANGEVTIASTEPERRAADMIDSAINEPESPRGQHGQRFITQTFKRTVPVVRRRQVGASAEEKNQMRDSVMNYSTNDPFLNQISRMIQNRPEEAAMYYGDASQAYLESLKTQADIQQSQAAANYSNAMAAGQQIQNQIMGQTDENGSTIAEEMAQEQLRQLKLANDRTEGIWKGLELPGLQAQLDAVIAESGMTETQAEFARAMLTLQLRSGYFAMWAQDQQVQQGWNQLSLAGSGTGAEGMTVDAALKILGNDTVRANAPDLYANALSFMASLQATGGEYQYVEPGLLQRIGIGFGYKPFVFKPYSVDLTTDGGETTTVTDDSFVGGFDPNATTPGQ